MGAGRHGPAICLVARPQDFVGSVELIAELRLPNAEIADRQIVRVAWRRAATGPENQREGEQISGTKRDRSDAADRRGSAFSQSGSSHGAAIHVRRAVTGSVPQKGAKVATARIVQLAPPRSV